MSGEGCSEASGWWADASERLVWRYMGPRRRGVCLRRAVHAEERDRGRRGGIELVEVDNWREGR